MNFTLKQIYLVIILESYNEIMSKDRVHILGICGTFMGGLALLRRGPNIVGPFGLLQPVADFLKLLLKEPIIPDKANKVIFIMAPDRKSVV